MGLGFHYAYQLGENTTADFYFAPVGDPALGPVAFPHRASAMELPQAPISHHWQDATHIADEVLTLGISHKKVRLEASGFYGSEPGENRWIIQSGPINSWATRFWFFPAKNWAAQVSIGRIAHPEALEPGDQVRATASLAYSRPMAGGSWSSSLIWGRNHSTATHRNLNSYLAEIGSSRQPRKLPHRPDRTGRQGRAFRRRAGYRSSPRHAIRQHVPRLAPTPSATRATSIYFDSSKPASEQTSAPTRCRTRSSPTTAAIPLEATFFSDSGSGRPENDREPRYDKGAIRCVISV